MEKEWYEIKDYKRWLGFIKMFFLITEIAFIILGIGAVITIFVFFSEHYGYLFLATLTAIPIFFIFSVPGIFMRAIIILLDKISQNANETSYSAKKSSTQNTIQAGSWRCNKCNKINASYVGTCSCGNVKKEEYTISSSPVLKEAQQDAEKLKNGGWRCSECNKVNAKYISICSCGNTKK